MHGGTEPLFSIDQGRAAHRARRWGLPLIRLIAISSKNTAPPSALLNLREAITNQTKHMDNGLSLDASSEVLGGVGVLALAVGGGKVSGGNSTVWKGRVKRRSCRKTETSRALPLIRSIAVSNSNTTQPSAR